MKNIGIILLLLSMLSVLMVCGCVENSLLNNDNYNTNNKDDNKHINTTIETSGFKVVKANKTLINKIKSSSSAPMYYYGGLYTAKSLAVAKASSTAINTKDITISNGVGYNTPRYSKTNVQVEGIDEGDIVKTDGKNIYFSRERIYRILRNNENNNANKKIIYPPYYGRGDVLIIGAYPPENMSVILEIPHTGKLYYIKNKLIIIDNIKRQIYAYNVSNPKNISLIWKLNLNGSYVDSRLYNGKLYLMVRQYSINYPIVWNNIKIDGSKYYIPIIPPYYYNEYKNIYIISKINCKNGDIENTLSTIGSYDTTIYMSKKNIYFTYYMRPNENRLFIDFIYKNADKYFPKDISSKIKMIYENKLFDDIPKFIQIRIIMENYLSTLSENDRINLMNKINKDYEYYLNDKFEDLESTGILKINIDNFKVKSGKFQENYLISFL